MSRNWRVLALAAALVVGLPLTAAAAQMDADEAPTAKGPLATGNQLKTCESDKFKPENKVLARFRVCSRYYLFNPEAETDETNDYGAFWIQLNADAEPGFCIKSIKTDLGFSEGVHAKAPQPGTELKPKAKKRYTTKLTVDAQGNSDSTGVLKNSFSVYPGTMRASRPKAGTYRLKWTGSTGRKLGFAAGLELSWPTGENAPDIDPRIVAKISPNC